MSTRFFLINTHEKELIIQGEMKAFEIRKSFNITK